MINILDKVEKMRLKRNWSEYDLSTHADLPQTTINTWYRKQKIPTLYSLDKLSSAFGITLSELLAETGDPMEITEQDQEILDFYRSLTPKQQKLLKQYLKSLTEHDAP